MSVILPNMNLIVSTINVDSGLTWEQNINADWSIIDQHNHTAGHGTLIPVDGLNIAADLTFQNNNAIFLRSIRFEEQSSVSGSSDLSCLYVLMDGNLYFNDGLGDSPIQITKGGSVNATSSGISSGTNSASFVSNVLVVNEAASTPANIQVGSVLLGNNVSGSNFLTLSPPSSMASSYSLTLPSIPASKAILTVDTSGNIASDTAYTTKVNQGINPTGAVVMFAGSSAPSGYLLCDGSSYSTTTYASLFAIIGYTYGGSGSSFNVPNTQGIFVRGAGSQTISGKTFSGTLGAQNLDSTSASGLSATSSDSGHAHTVAAYHSTSFAGSQTDPPQQATTSTYQPYNTATSYANITTYVNSIYTETAPGNIALNYIIKS